MASFPQAEQRSAGGAIDGAGCALSWVVAEDKISADCRDSEGRNMKFDPPHVARSLSKSWSRASARQWTEANPAAGQCNVTALLVYELFGGELLKTHLPEGDHLYNWIDGQRYDFAESQFSQPICYADIPTTSSEAERGATSSELAALKAAFVRHSTSCS
jgi:hypothetical protein